MYRTSIAAVAAWAALALAAAAQKNPFSADVSTGTNDPASARVVYRVPDGHYIYADRLGAAVNGVSLRPLQLPVPKTHDDELLGEKVAIYDTDAPFIYSLPDGARPPLTLTVTYQGCSMNPALCFPPNDETFALGPAGTPAVRVVAGAPAAGGAAAAEPGGGLQIRGRASGYLASDAFLAFLDQAESGKGGGEDRLQTVLRERGAWVALLVILVFGLALNLTPCVLPMIPINLAIIGAGARAGSRGRGFALGSAYGAAIALVYGALGLAVVLAGVKFGALNSSPVFNLAIAALFLVLALAMFDVLHIDFSRFQSAGAQGRPRGGFLTAFVMGGVAALLAGACVAPVVISVLLLSASLYARGVAAGLLLPFVLGLGMALPWPFAGAGLSFLPGPGRWMQWVKYGFGVFIVGFALWYGRLGVSLLRERSPASAEAVAASRAEQIDEGGWLTSLPEALAESARSGKPVLIDFWATWCKNCLHMDKTTFQDPAVTQRLAGYVKVKFQAEDIRAETTRAVLDRFGVIGLPTYVVLAPGAAAGGSIQ